MFDVCTFFILFNLLDWKEKHLGNSEVMVEKVLTLEKAKGQALAGRGLCFLERGQLKEALRDLHLGLQMFPGIQMMCCHYSLWDLFVVPSRLRCTVYVWN